MGIVVIFAFQIFKYNFNKYNLRLLEPKIYNKIFLLKNLKTIPL